MPGFSVAIGDLVFPKEKISSNLQYGSIKGAGFSLSKFTINKFENDKIFIETDLYIIVIEGIVLNKSELSRGYENWEQTVISLYENYGNTFFSHFTGSFSGALYDKLVDKWIIFTDHIGSKHIYFTTVNNELYVSSDISRLYAFFKSNHLDYGLDEIGAYMLLSYGYMLEDYTLCENIRKLTGGKYIHFEDGEIQIKNYFEFSEESTLPLSEDEGIEKIDYLFRKAIKLQFDKDREYGYKHLVSLSGGLDSRMTTWVANDLGYTNQINLTFSQSGYLDEITAKKIASDLKHEWIFKALDNGLFLTDIDEINRITGGNVLYYTLAHSNSMLKYLNFEELGCLHTGQVGGIIKGYYSKKEDLTMGGAYSTKLISKAKRGIKRSYPYERDFLLNNRQFNGTLFGDIGTQTKTETMSPYLSKDLMSIGLDSTLFKTRDDLMRKWILRKYPEAGNYIWESSNAKLTGKYIKIGDKLFSVRQIPGKALRKLFNIDQSFSKHHMNPLGYWYNNNEELRVFQDNYFDNNLERLSDHESLMIDCSELYKNGKGIEKIQVLTLLSALKLFF